MKLKFALSLLLAASGASHALEAPLTAEELSHRGLAAGVDYPGLADICNLSKPLVVAGQRPAGAAQRARPENAGARTAPLAMPTRVFDNLYFVGHSGVSSWAITTPEGIILIDAMNNNDEARDYIEKGLIALNLDPKDIKYLVITHGHGDHYGGQQYLVDKYAPRVIMSDVDWTMLESGKLEFNNPRWGKPPKRDMAVADGDTLSLGALALNFYVTPGHTAGTLSMIFPVRDKLETHHVALWGGTGLNFGPNEKRIKDYAASAARFKDLAQQAKADVFLTSHPNRDGTMQRIERLRTRTSDEPNPFVSQRALGAFELLSDCAQAQAMSLVKK